MASPPNTVAFCYRSASPLALDCDAILAHTGGEVRGHCSRGVPGCLGFADSPCRVYGAAGSPQPWWEQEQSSSAQVASCFGPLPTLLGESQFPHPGFSRMEKVFAVTCFQSEQNPAVLSSSAQATALLELCGGDLGHF